MAFEVKSPHWSSCRSAECGGLCRDPAHSFLGYSLVFYVFVVRVNEIFSSIHYIFCRLSIKEPVDFCVLFLDLALSLTYCFRWVFGCFSPALPRQTVMSSADPDPDPLLCGICPSSRSLSLASTFRSLGCLTRVFNESFYQPIRLHSVVLYI